MNNSGRSGVRRSRNRAVVHLIHDVSSARQMPCSRETGETCMNGATRSSKFRVRSSENLELRTSNRRPSRPSCELRSSRLTRPAPPVCEDPARIMWAVSFTFKYLPNIIRKFCTHVAVRDTFALTAWVSHVRNRLFRHHRTRPGCVVCDWASRLRKNYFSTGELQWSARAAQRENTRAGFSKRPSSKAAASEGPRRTLWGTLRV